MRLSILEGALALSLAISSQAQSQDSYFRDDFTGPSLKPELIFLAEDKDRWTLVENDYLMIIPRKYEGGTTNRLAYEGDIFENYSFTISAKSIPSHRYFTISMSISDGGDSYIGLWYYVGQFSRSVTFRKQLKSEPSDYVYEDKVLKNANDLKLSIQKKGFEYIGYFSVDGANWISVGTHALLRYQGKPSFGTHNWKPGPEPHVRFDYVEIRPID